MTHTSLPVGSRHCLETRRLHLACPGGIEPLRVLDFHISNRSFHAPWDPVRPDSFFTLDGVVATLESQAGASLEGTGYAWYLCEQGSSCVCGFVGISNIVRGPFQSCFLGYKMAADHIGRNMMTEALSTVVPWVFDSLVLHRIEANVMPRNKASIRVLEKSGFVCEGLSPKYLRIAGVWEDHLHYVLLNDACG